MPSYHTEPRYREPSSSREQHILWPVHMHAEWRGSPRMHRSVRNAAVSAMTRRGGAMTRRSTRSPLPRPLLLWHATAPALVAGGALLPPSVLLALDDTLVALALLPLALPLGCHLRRRAWPASGGPRHGQRAPEPLGAEAELSAALQRQPAPLRLPQWARSRSRRACRRWRCQRPSRRLWASAHPSCDRGSAMCWTVRQLRPEPFKLPRPLARCRAVAA
jgi:hypothetical protein